MDHPTDGNTIFKKCFRLQNKYIQASIYLISYKCNFIQPIMPNMFVFRFS